MLSGSSARLLYLLPLQDARPRYDLIGHLRLSNGVGGSLTSRDTRLPPQRENSQCNSAVEDRFFFARAQLCPLLDGLGNDTN